MIEFALRVRDEDADDVLDWLLLAAPYGVFDSSADGETVLRIRGEEHELPTRGQLEATGGEKLLGIEEREVPDDWEARRLEDYEEVVVGGRLVIRPDWAPPAGEGLIDVAVRDTGFGSGEHATTRLVLEQMLELEPTGAFVDLGCGSGVLALAASKLGWAPVKALDNDPAAVGSTLFNAKANGVSLEAAIADLLEEIPPSAPTVVANIPVPVHLQMAGRFERLPDVLIATAIRLDEVDAVSEAYQAAGMDEAERRTEGTWVSLKLVPRRSPSST